MLVSWTIYLHKIGGGGRPTHIRMVNSSLSGDLSYMLSVHVHEASSFVSNLNMFLELLVLFRI